MLNKIWSYRCGIVTAGFALFLLSWLWVPSAHHLLFKGLVGVPFLCFCLKDSWSALRRNRLLQAVLLFFLYMAFTVLVREIQHPAVLFLWARRIGWTLVFLLTAHWIRSQGKAALLGQIYLAGSLLAALASIVHYFQFYNCRGGAFRLFSVFSCEDPVTSGFMFMQGAIWALVLTLGELRRGWLAVCMAAYCVSVAAATFTFSRGSWLGLLAAWAVILLFVRTRRSVRLAALGAGVLVASMLLTVALDTQFPQSVDSARAKGVSRIMGSKTSGRTSIYQSVLQTMDGRYLFGTGLQSENSRFTINNRGAYHPHSIPLWVFYHGGAVGLIFFGTMVGMAFWFGLLNFREQNSVVVLLLASGVAALLFDGAALIRSGSANEWFLYWMPIAFIAAEMRGTCGAVAENKSARD